MMSYGLYLARIVGAPKENDSRLQIKVLPQMSGIVDANCPRWPYFFKNEFLIGSTGDLAWVICNDDFSLGYVLGLANYTTYAEDEDFSKYSLSESLKDKVLVAFGELGVNKFSFKNLMVTYWNTTCIHMIEKNTGGVIYAYDNGTLYIFRKDEFIVKIGQSIIKMDSSGLGMSTPSHISVDAPDVGLGRNPGRYVMVTGGTGDKIASVSGCVRA